MHMMLENIKLAIQSLKANKLRALLTMLGIIIGIGSVITIVTIGDAMTGSINSEWSGYGAKNVTVQVSDRNSSGYDSELDYSSYTWSEPKDSELLTEAMVQDYETRFSSRIKALSISNDMGTSKFINGKHFSNTELSGVSTGAQEVDKVKMAAGQFITKDNIKNSQPVIVVSDRFVQEYYGGRVTTQDAIGKDVILDLNQKVMKLYISGVYTYEEADGGLSYSKDSGTKAYMPYSTSFSFQAKPVLFKKIVIQPTEETDAKTFLTDTSTYFESYYTSNEKITALTSSMAGMLKSMNKMLDQIKLGIGGVAAISLLVGGVGVMNIMMVSVSERTREIGIRMALGAKGSLIRFQFLVEAVIISLCGGAIGVILGLILGSSISSMMHYKAVPSIPAIAVSVLFSMAIGIFFGYAPANRASKLDPIEALRYE
jgi:putative ABC transport system permease protein